MELFNLLLQGRKHLNIDWTLVLCTTLTSDHLLPAGGWDGAPVGANRADHVGLSNHKAMGDEEERRLNHHYTPDGLDQKRGLL